MATGYSSRAVFYSKPVQLQDLACVNVASYLWYYEKKDKYYGTKTIIQLSQLPTVIQNMIYENVDAVSQSLNRWCSLNSYLFVESAENANICDFELVDLISWSAADVINYRETARKLIRSDKLSGKQKYKVACVYCFPEDIEAFVSEKHEDSHPLVEYWNCRMENKANSSIAENNEYSSPEAAILWNCEANDGWITLPAFQFLWQYLTDDERMQIIIKRCRVLKNFLSYALCNLDEKQLDCVVESNAAQILIILFHESQTVFMLLWNHVKSRNIITVSSFFEIMLHLVQNGAPVGYTAAFDVWISASDELRKETVISQNADILLKRLLKTHSLLDIRNVPGETRLLMELLSAYPSEKRETIWNELWENIIFGTPVEYMQMVMKRCLGCDDKICKFKKMYLCKYSEIGRYLRYLLYCNGFQTLNMFLSFKSFITDDTEIIRDLRINLMKSVHFFDGYFSAFKSGSAKEIATFDKFIDETLSDASQLEDFKKYLIIREDPSHHVFKRTMMDGEFNSNIPGFCDHVLSSMPHLLNQVKNMLLEYCYDAVDYACFGHESTSHFTDWEKTVMWCLNEDIHLLEKFKRRFDVNSVFWMWINKCMRELKTMNLELCVDENGVFRNCYFEALQCLLRWLLEDSGKILDLKRDEFETVRLSKKYKFLLKSNKQPQIDALRKWFFHIDDVNVYYSDNFEASLFEECVD